MLEYIWRRHWHPSPVLLPGKSHGQRSLVGYSPWGHKELDTTDQLYLPLKPGFPGGSDGKEFACSVGDLSLTPGWEDPLEKGVATHCGILAWSIPWTEEPGGSQSMGLQTVRYN